MKLHPGTTLNLYKETIKCDAFGCGETFPLNHEYLGEPGYEHGRWPGWIFVDFNRREFFSGTMRFCSLPCFLHWLHLNMKSENAIDRRASAQVVESLLNRVVKKDYDYHQTP